MSRVWMASLIAVAMSTAAVAQTAPDETDRYQWLEEAQNPEALAWAQPLTQQSLEALGQLPGHQRIERELIDLMAAGDPPPSYSLLGSMILRVQRSAANPHGILSVSDRDANGHPGAWRQLLDIDALGREEDKPYELGFGLGALSCLAPPVARCMVALSPDGGDETELREFDLTTGQFVADGFRAPSSRSWVTWLDRDRLLIQHSADGAPVLPNTWAAETYIWRRGTPLSQAQPVYRAEPTDALTWVATAGRGVDRTGVIVRAIDYSTFEYRLVRPDGSVEMASLPTKVKLSMWNSTGPRILVQMAEDDEVAGRRLPAETILAYETDPAIPENERLSVVYVPTPGDFVSQVMGSQNKVRIVLDNRGVQRVLTYSRTPSGWSVQEGDRQAVGLSSGFGMSDPTSDDIIGYQSGYLTPENIDLLTGSGEPYRLFSEEPAFDASKYRVDLKSATSKDGTEIDYYLIRPIELEHPGATPTLITGYGGFGISFAPSYLSDMIGGKPIITWFERGGAVVWPMIRGGGERGAAWQQAAAGIKRQTGYDDFFAVAEALVDENFTTPQHLGVFGTSNGGLLAAVAGTQRPDLFGAIVSDVPITDLKRFTHMGIGAGWTLEYGNPDDPEMWPIMRTYSPYHLVQPGVEYPPFLITISTADIRVGAGHARKLAARLQEVGSPVYFIEDHVGGHGVTDPLSRPKLVADRMTFLIDALK